MNNIFKKFDFNKSPFTGLTRASFIEAGKYLLSSPFENLKDLSSPLKFERSEFEITYVDIAGESFSDEDIEYILDTIFSE